MTDLRRLRGRVLVAGALVMLAVGGVVLARKNGAGSEVVEVRLVARNMTYFVEGGSDPNPILHVPRGSRLRVVLTNDDQGYTHNLTVPALSVESPLIVRGKVQTVEVRLPDEPGALVYSCGPHAQMMRGTIAIE